MFREAADKISAVTDSGVPQWERSFRQSEEYAAIEYAGLPVECCIFIR
jgi:hypothetical protein